MSTNRLLKNAHLRRFPLGDRKKKFNETKKKLDRL
jgi:hypothetical protein